MRKISKAKRHLPLWYFLLAMVLVCYGWISIFYQRFSVAGTYIHAMNLFNLSLTLFWVLLNGALIGKMLKDGFGMYPREEAFVPVYYFFLNVANTFLLYATLLAGWFSVPFGVQFWIAISTKSLESVFLPLLFWKRLRK